jgi:hypothetical protein
MATRSALIRPGNRPRSAACARGQEVNKHPTINAFWAGPTLGRMHAACLQSFLRVGHEVVLHTYDPAPSDIPDGVKIGDASIILPLDRVTRHRSTGSLSMAADRFRFEFMAAGLGIYVDCYCVQPIPDREFIFGWQDNETIATGVLKLPKNGKILSSMMAMSATRGFVPPWVKTKIQRQYRIRAAFGRPVPLEDMMWGTLGPVGLTYYAKQYGLAEKAQPIDEYYPVGFHQAALLRDPGVQLSDLITPRTKIVHLWNEFQRKIGAPPPVGSPLHQIINEVP